MNINLTTLKAYNLTKCPDRLFRRAQSAALPAEKTAGFYEISPEFVKHAETVINNDRHAVNIKQIIRSVVTKIKHDTD